MKHQYLQNLNEFFIQDQNSILSNIYFFENIINKNQFWKNKVKIGYSKNIEKRIKQLSIGNPYPIKLWYSFEIEEKRASYIENQLHKKFKYSRKQGEWFYINKQLRIFISIHKLFSMYKDKNNSDINREEALKQIKYILEKGRLKL